MSYGYGNWEAAQALYAQANADYVQAYQFEQAGQMMIENADPSNATDYGLVAAADFAYAALYNWLGDQADAQADALLGY